LSLGEVLEKIAKFSEAHSALQQSLALYNELGHRYYITEAHTFLGSIDVHQGRYEEARGHLEVGLVLAREHGPRYCIAECLFSLGCIELAQGAPATAHPLLQESIALYRETGPQDNLGVALACTAIAAHRLGDKNQAQQHLLHAFQMGNDLGAAFLLLWALPAMALLLADLGEIERAVELYALASRYLFVAKSSWFGDVVCTQITTAAYTLPAGRVSDLKERGRARDLNDTVRELYTELSGATLFA
jgi:tetratricopeptide (TPR) repeat protein